MEEPRFCFVPKDHKVIIYKRVTCCKFFFLALILAVCLMFLFNGCVMYFWQPLEEYDNDFFVDFFLTISAVSFLIAIIFLICITSPTFGGVEMSRALLREWIHNFLDVADNSQFEPSSRSSRVDHVEFGTGSRSSRLDEVVESGGLPSYSEVFLLPSHSQNT